MFRKTGWRNTVSDAVNFHQDQALSTTIFLLKSFGPTGFLLREEGEARNFKVNHSLIQDACRSNSKRPLVSLLQLGLSCSCCSGVLGWPTYVHVSCVHQGAGAVQTHLLVTHRKPLTQQEVLANDISHGPFILLISWCMCSIVRRTPA